MRVFGLEAIVNAGGLEKGKSSPALQQAWLDARFISILQ